MSLFFAKKKATDLRPFLDLVAGAGFIRAYGPHPFGAAASGVLRTFGPCEPAFLISS